MYCNIGYILLGFYIFQKQNFTMECKSGAKEHCKLSLKLADVILKLQKRLDSGLAISNRSELQRLLDNAIVQQDQLDRQFARVMKKHCSHFVNPCDCSLESVDKNWFPL